jgi:hypothetical protein
MLTVLRLLETFLKLVFPNTTQVLRRILFDGVNVVESLSIQCHFKFVRQPEVTGSHVRGVGWSMNHSNAMIAKNPEPSELCARAHCRDAEPTREIPVTLASCDKR